MNLPFKTILKVVPISLIVVGICLFPLLFSSGCNYDPYQNVSDTITYKVSGTVRKLSDGQPNPGISVCLRDSLGSNKSARATTDTTGNYSITWPYLRRNTLFLHFDDFDPKNGDYKSESVEVSFDAAYFKYSFQKSQDRSLELKLTK